MRTPAVVYQEPTAVFHGYVPRSPLDRWVALIWFVSGVPAVGAERVLPNGVVELIINLGPPHRVVDEVTGSHRRYHAAWLAGMQTSSLTIAADASSELVGVRFRTGGAFPFLAVPLANVTNQVIELDQPSGIDVPTLRDRLLPPATELERLAIVEAALLARAAVAAPTDRRVQRAAALVATASHGRTVSQIAADIGVSHKHLIQLFRREIGVGPKMLARITRFQTALRTLEAAPTSSWTAIAHAAGYADHAHLTNEFRVLAGTTPTAYRHQRTVDPNHIAVAAR